MDLGSDQGSSRFGKVSEAMPPWDLFAAEPTQYHPRFRYAGISATVRGISNPGAVTAQVD